MLKNNYSNVALCRFSYCRVLKKKYANPLCSLAAIVDQITINGQPFRCGIVGNLVERSARIYLNNTQNDLQYTKKGFLTH